MGFARDYLLYLSLDLITSNGINISILHPCLADQAITLALFVVYPPIYVITSKDAAYRYLSLSYDYLDSFSLIKRLI